MAPRLVSKNAFASIAKVAPSTVTRAVKTTLAPAMVADRIDVDHPAARAFVARHARRKARW